MLQLVFGIETVALRMKVILIEHDLKTYKRHIQSIKNLPIQTIINKHLFFNKKTNLFEYS